jgi:site-specific DNA-methyltransferase (adenine-specific)
MQDARVVHGHSLEQLKSLKENSLDSMVTDPPAGIAFMGKAWDSYDSLHHFQEDLAVIFKEALRVLKPGAHGLVWALPRTSMFTGMALIDAGFEVRDTVLHLFGSGMPKGQNIAKAIEKTGESEAAKQWEGWNTTLKPAHEVWWLVRKPLQEDTIARQVLTTGTGAINVEESRISTTENLNGGAHSKGRVPRAMSPMGLGHAGGRKSSDAGEYKQPSGRWPANTVLTHAADCEDDKCAESCAVALLDEQSGFLHGAGNVRPSTCGKSAYTYGGGWNALTKNPNYHENSGGGASRFFYTAKVPPSERKLPDGTLNQHPTAKSIKLMRYFVKLVTPPKGTVLDPFAGSGTTGVAAVKEGFSFLGIELDQEHHRVASLRVQSALQEHAGESHIREMLIDE